MVGRRLRVRQTDSGVEPRLKELPRTVGVGGTDDPGWWRRMQAWRRWLSWLWRHSWSGTGAVNAISRRRDRRRPRRHRDADRRHDKVNRKMARLRLILPGRFTMGCSSRSLTARTMKPTHAVEITRGFLPLMR
jgi:hypothetical protein